MRLVLVLAPMSSAPSESFTGGAAIKKVFKSWKIDLYADMQDHTRAGIAPGGDLEGNAWKIVHQHYSDTVSVP